jgi:hypothetical protein
MATLSAEVNARGWRRMSVVELEGLILAIRRHAVQQHLSLSTWDLVDRLRKRAAEPRKEAAE